MTEIESKSDIYVYVAGAYTLGDVAENVRRAIDAGERLARLGYTVFIPHLNHFWGIIHQHPPQFWLDDDKKWLRLCHCVFSLTEGISGGSDGEEAFIRELGRLVFYSMDELDKWGTEIIEESKGE